MKKQFLAKSSLRSRRLLFFLFALSLILCVVLNSYSQVKETDFQAMFCVEFQGKFGLIDAAGDEVVPCKYDLIGSQGVECKPCFDFGLGPMSKKVFREGLARVKLNGKWGVIDTIGNEVVSCKYDEIYDFKEGLAEAILNGKHVLIDKTGKEIRTFDYSEPDIVLYKLGITRVEFNGKRCWIGINGLPITPDKSYKESGSDYGPYQINIPGSSIVTYKEARILGEGILGVQDILIDKWGLIDRNGKVVAPCKYDKICGLFKEGLVEVILNDRHCLIDKTGKEVTPCKYDEIGDFHAGLAGVKLNGKWGFIDKSGREIIPCKYDGGGGVLGTGLCCVEMKHKIGFIDKTGRQVTPCKYDLYYNSFEPAPPYSRVMTCVEMNGKRGLIDETGKEVVPCKYQGAYHLFRNSKKRLYTVCLDKRAKGVGSEQMFLPCKCGVIDGAGKEVVSFKYDGVEYFNDNTYIIFLNEKDGLINKTGRVILPCKYEDILPFNEVIAAVKLHEKWGIIDTTGREIITPKYNDIGYFKPRFSEKGPVFILSSGKYGFIDTKGREIVPPKYDDIE